MFWCAVIIVGAIIFIIHQQNKAEREREEASRKTINDIEYEKKLAAEQEERKAERERQTAEKRAAEILAQKAEEEKQLKITKIKESDFFKIISNKLNEFFKSEFARAIKENEDIEPRKFMLEVTNSAVIVYKVYFKYREDKSFYDEEECKTYYNFHDFYEGKEIYRINYNSIGFDSLEKEETDIVRTALISTGYYYKYQMEYSFWVINLNSPIVASEQWQNLINPMINAHKSQFKKAFE